METLTANVETPEREVIFARKGEIVDFPSSGEQIAVSSGETALSILAHDGPILHGNDYRLFGWVHNRFTGQIMRKFTTINEGYVKAWAGRFDPEGHGLVYIEKVYRKAVAAASKIHPRWEATVKELHETGISHAICENDKDNVREYKPTNREANVYDNGGLSYRWSWKAVSEVPVLKNLEMGAKMVALEARNMTFCKRCGIARYFLEEAFQQYWIDHPELRARKHAGDIITFMINNRPYVYHVVPNRCDWLELHKITWPEHSPETITL